MKTTLVIMAAGIGSRFGTGIKQLTRFGIHDELIIDFSIYDALRAGFDKVVFIIRRAIEKEFKEVIGDRISKITEVEYVYQELDMLPEPYAAPVGREKPWGTAQAVLCCKNVVKEPFAVINADDFYGEQAFRLAHDYLVSEKAEKKGIFDVCMVSFLLDNTLSDNGGVTRGICSFDAHGKLSGVTETYNLIRRGKKAISLPPKGSGALISLDSIVSMNFWCLRPEVFDILDREFGCFLAEHYSDNSSEFLLPNFIDKKLRLGEADVTVVNSNDNWFGVTYKDDVPPVKQAIKDLIARGIYPEKLF